MILLFFPLFYMLSFQNVYLHGVPFTDDLIELFSDPTMLNVKLEVTLIGNDGNNEDGTGDGVLREILTSFWQLVYHSLTVGTGKSTMHKA